MWRSISCLNDWVYRPTFKDRFRTVQIICTSHHEEQFRLQCHALSQRYIQEVNCHKSVLVLGTRRPHAAPRTPFQNPSSHISVSEHQLSSPSPIHHSSPTIPKQKIRATVQIHIPIISSTIPMYLSFPIPIPTLLTPVYKLAQ